MKKLLIALFVMIGMVSCNSFKINVNLENSNGKTVYLQRYDGSNMQTIDSVIAKNNVSVFKVKKSDNLDALNIMMKGWRRPLTFFADNQDVAIKGDYQVYKNIKISASESQNKLNAFMEEVDKIENDNEIHDFTLGFVKQNLDNCLSPYVVYRYKWAFTYDELKSIYQAMPENMKSAYKDLVATYIDGLERTQNGKPYIDFKQKDVNGDIFKMSDLIGKSKAIIIDFWASWCPDCRKANPELVKIYNQFKDKGLDIVSVSLDTDEAAWKKAITDDNLAWKHHVSDLKGWNNEVAGLYTIAYIPQSFILDANGKIVEKNLPAEKMGDVLSNLLK